MCGIAGIYSYARADGVDEAELSAIRDHMRARGPDGQGLWLSDDRRIGLGHRRLSIIDLSQRAAQPMQSADGRFVITFNGEIYNYRALRGELESHGYSFRTTSDTEVLLQLYADRGERMLDALRGMFAFALWDGRDRSLLLARDPYGIKPLYYADDGRVLRFASQVKALAACGRVSRTLDPAGQVGFYLFGSVPEPHTVYSAIRALPAGSMLRMDDDRQPKAPMRYFSVAECWRKALDEPVVDAVATRDHVRSALLDSIEHHLVADVPIALFLSAGIDSGALAALVAETGASGHTAVTLAFAEMAGTRADESALAAEVARKYGFSHHRRVVTRAEFEGDVPAIFAAMDQPTVDGINTWFVSKATAELGVKVALSGLGGDELFGGYPSFREVPRWVGAMQPFARAPLLGTMVRRLAAPWLARQDRLSPKLAGMLELGGSYAGAYLLKRALFMPWELESVLPAELVREGLRTMSPLAHLESLLVPDPETPVARVATLEACHYMRNQLLRDTDWASMAHSLEARVPLVDRGLLSQLGPMITRDPSLRGKRWLADAPRDPLPRSIVDRVKTGFSTPVETWLERAPSLGAWRAVPALKRTGCPWARRWAFTVGRAHFAAS